MKLGTTKRRLALVGLALVIGMFGSPAAAQDLTCLEGAKAEMCFGGGPTQNGGAGFFIGGGRSSHAMFSMWGFGHPGGTACGTHACGSQGTFHEFGFDLTGPMFGRDGWSGGVSGSHGPWCTICYQEYHVAGGNLADEGGRLCYEPTRTPPLYRC